MGYYVATCSLMREQPSSDARVISEALYAEPILIQDCRADWSLIQTPDQYMGWILTSAITTRSNPYPNTQCLHVCRKAAHIYSVKDTEWGAILTLPFGTPLQILEGEDERWMKVLLLNDKEAYVHRGDVAPRPSFAHKKELIPFSMQFLDLPYTWGGRSSFGFDCSGFVQMLYRHLNIHLARDSYLQIQDSRFKEVDIDQIEAGDLLFFGKEPDKISHVGMSLGGHHFIHTSPLENLPFLRISHLNDPLWNAASRFRTARQLIV